MLVMSSHLVPAPMRAGSVKGNAKRESFSPETEGEFVLDTQPLSAVGPVFPYF
jgi:hypothetical protein